MQSRVFNIDRLSDNIKAIVLRVVAALVVVSLKQTQKRFIQTFDLISRMIIS